MPLTSEEREQVIDRFVRLYAYEQAFTSIGPEKTKEMLRKVLAPTLESEVTVAGWITRDKDAVLMLNDSKPRRAKDQWEPEPNFLILPPSLCPNLAWEDDPVWATVSFRVGDVEVKQP